MIMYSSHIRVIDPVGCGCSDCDSSDGKSIPLDRATPEQVVRMLIDGMPANDTGETFDLAVHWDLDDRHSMTDVRPGRITVTTPGGRSWELTDITDYRWAVRYR
ncbi:hypothetical protein ACQEVF_59050 [Nonomuraea polychroma]|uniref:hypothetical protein n=1 Tax=Nonomuraea polychroma TaxID=46176 RepID=UPI003D948F90